MILSENQVGSMCRPGKTPCSSEKWWKMGKPCEVAAVYGVDLSFLCWFNGFPEECVRVRVRRGIKGKPVKVVKGDVTDLLFPQTGDRYRSLSYPNQFKDEGPFGEFTGYYGRPGGDTPFIGSETYPPQEQSILTAA